MDLNHFPKLVDLLNKSDQKNSLIDIAILDLNRELEIINRQIDVLSSMKDEEFVEEEESVDEIEEILSSDLETKKEKLPELVKNFWEKNEDVVVDTLDLRILKAYSKIYEGEYPPKDLTNTQMNKLIIENQIPKSEILFLRTIVHPLKHDLTTDERRYLNHLIENIGLTYQLIQYLLPECVRSDYKFIKNDSEYSSKIDRYINFLDRSLEESEKKGMSTKVEISEELIHVEFFQQPISALKGVKVKHIQKDLKRNGFRRSIVILDNIQPYV